MSNSQSRDKRRLISLRALGTLVSPVEFLAGPAFEEACRLQGVPAVSDRVVVRFLLSYPTIRTCSLARRVIPGAVLVVLAGCVGDRRLLLPSRRA